VNDVVTVTVSIVVLLSGVPHILVWLIIHSRLGPGGRWRLKVEPRFVLVRSKPSSPSLVSVTLPKKVG